MEFLAQAIGFIGLLFIVISYQKDKRLFTLLCHLCSATAFTIHYSLLGAFTGAAMNGISVARAAVFAARDKYSWLNQNYVMYLFVALFWIGGLLTWQSWLSILPIIGMSIECFALWSNSTRTLRWLFLAARPFWGTYNILVGSIPGIIAEAFVITSLVVAIVRFRKNAAARI